MPGKIGIVAGGGALPALLIAACRSTGRPVFVLGLKGHAEPDRIGDAPHGWVRLGAAGKALEILRKEGVEELVIAGKVVRPSMAQLRPDGRMLKFFGKIGQAAFRDGALMNAIADALEEEGFRVVSPESLLGTILAEDGPYGRHVPDQDARADIERGIEVAKALGAADVGQAVVVQQGMVLGVEAAEGTSALIRRCRELALPGRGGVLVKIPKPAQDRRIDLPTIGPDTVDDAIASGLAGIAVAAGGALVLDAPVVAEKADAAGLFVTGVAVSP